MTTPTPAKLAEKLARSDPRRRRLAAAARRERLRIFGDLKVSPTITVDANDRRAVVLVLASPSARRTSTPRSSGCSSCRASSAPSASARWRSCSTSSRRSIDIDPRLPRLMRAVFQQQPEVAHVYLGSKRHMLRRLFSDENEPFWRSAKQMELGVIEAAEFAAVHQAPVRAQRALHQRRGGRRDPRDHRRPPLRDAGALLLRLAGGGRGGAGGGGRRRRRAGARSCAPSTRTSRCCGSAPRACSGCCWPSSPREPGRPLSADYRNRHNLPGPSTVQRAVETLERDELVARERGLVRIVEPFLAAWLQRDMRVP